jgi:hypothetical protein
MDMFVTSAEQPAVVDTLADQIVAAATGRTLRVAIACTRPDDVAFAHELGRALRLRGRRCRYLPPIHHSGDRSIPNEREVVGRPIAVIISGVHGPEENDLCRINIQLHAPGRPGPVTPGRERVSGPR